MECVSKSAVCVQRPGGIESAIDWKWTLFVIAFFCQKTKDAWDEREVAASSRVCTRFILLTVPSSYFCG